MANNGQLDKPDYTQMELKGIEEAVTEEEHLSMEEVRRRSEGALAALAALRVRSVVYSEGEPGLPVGSKEEEPRWMKIYRRLREEGWNWRVAAYIAWAAQPKKYRWPETQEELAQQCLGLTSDRAIATWRKRNPNIDERIALLQGAIVFDSLADGMQAMVDVATTPNYKSYQDRKMMFEMGKIYTSSSKLTAEMVKTFRKGGGDESDMSTEELRDFVRIAGEEIKRRSETSDEDEK